jgi:hypothetical protein
MDHIPRSVRVVPAAAQQPPSSQGSVEEEGSRLGLQQGHPPFPFIVLPSLLQGLSLNHNVLVTGGCVGL